jgi:hypothetical protein
LYDSIGARASAIVGAIGVIIGTFGIFLALYFKSLEMLLWVAIPLADSFGFLNSFAVMGLVWHMEEHQGNVLVVY